MSRPTFLGGGAPRCWSPQPSSEPPPVCPPSKNPRTSISSKEAGTGGRGAHNRSSIAWRVGGGGLGGGGGDIPGEVVVVGGGILGVGGWGWGYTRGGGGGGGGDIGRARPRERSFVGIGRCPVDI
jgi:hypothetical protein